MDCKSLIIFFETKSCFQNCYSSPKIERKAQTAASADQMESLHSLRGKVLDGQATLLAPSEAVRETIRFRLLGRQDLILKKTEADN